MSRRRKQNPFIRGRQRAEIPTSSMADIAFLLIIFFMLTSVFATTKGLSFELPDGESGDDPEDAVLIHVFAEETHVDCSPMDAAQLRDYLAPRLARNPDKPLILYVESDAPYRRMVEMYDLFAGIGATRNVQVPTQVDLDAYRAAFGDNPLASHCGP